jgi:hypothetical protein
MADKKIEKALYGPSLTEVALGAVLGLFLGVVAACIYLVFKPVQEVKELPKEPSRSVVYFIPGSESNAKSKGWQAKEKALIAGTGVQLVEDELNAWASSQAGPPVVAKPAAKPKPGDKAKAPAKKADEAKADEGKAAPLDGFVIPAKLNFRIVGDKLQVGMKCTLNWYGLTYDTTVMATGGFRRSGDVFEFAADRVYLGSCPLHLVPAASGLLVSTIASKQKLSDDLRIALTRISAVNIEGGTLKLAVQ